MTRTIKEIAAGKITKAFIFGLLIAFPILVSAAIVPCGGTGQEACRLCHFFGLLDNIVDFVMFKIVPPIAVVLLIAGGVFMLLSGGNPSGVTKGKSILLSTLIGLALVYGAYLLVNTFFLAIGVSEWTGLQSGWFKYPCY